MARRLLTSCSCYQELVSDVSVMVKSVRDAVTRACRGLVGRQALVELVVLCAVAREHLLVVGPPGTAKSEAVRRIARRLDGSYFEYLLGRFTEPSELFGPVDLRKLKEGIVETSTAGMLPEAEFAFLDEVFLGSTAILNTLLAILNERTFRRGHTMLACPMRVCVGAANRLPEDDQLAAFADRFLVRVFVQPVDDSGLEDLLETGWTTDPAVDRESVGREQSIGRATMADIDALTKAAFAMTLESVRPALARAVRLVRAAGIEWSDRRVVRVQRLVAAAAVLAGRQEATEADLWPIAFALPTEDAQRVGRDALRDMLALSENGSLLAAAAEGSLAPVARSALLLKEAEATFAARPSVPGSDGPWRLQVEAIAREIDATFTAATMPEDIVHLRSRVVGVLEERPEVG